MFGLIPAVLAQNQQESAIDLKANVGSSFSRLTSLELGEILSWLITVALVIAGLVFFFMLVIGGVRWIVSGGDKAGTEGARNQITAALIGLIIVFSAWAIATLISNAFGVNILTPNIPIVGS